MVKDEAIYDDHLYKIQFDKMTKTPVSKLILLMGFPSMICILITHIYNLVDTFFVGKLGTSASGAVGVVFGIMAILQAFGFMYGQGSGVIVSRLLGEKKDREANVVASAALFTSFATGMVLSLAGFCLLKPMLYGLGSTETIFPFAKEYAIWIFLSAPFIMSSLTLNNLFRYQGKAFMGTLGIGAGAVLNMILDPVLMFSFGWGVRGAGVSTAISQCISFAVLMAFFQSRHCQLTFRVQDVRYFLKEISCIVAVGMPAFLGQVLATLSTMCLNLEAKVYGDAAIAAMSIAGRVSFLMFAVSLGIAQGFQPVGGFNYGAEKYGRVRKGFLFALVASETILGIFAIIGMVEADGIIAVFRNDAEVRAIGGTALFLQCFGILFAPLLICTNILLQSAGRNRASSLVSSMRNGLFFLPLILVFPRHWGLTGIEFAQPVADVLGFLVTLPMAIRLCRQLKQREEQSQIR